jgi:hypothetical protein
MTYEYNHENERTVRNLSVLPPYFAARREDVIRYMCTQIHVNIVEACQSNEKILKLANICLALGGFKKYLQEFRERAEDESDTFDIWFYSYYIKSGFLVTSKSTISAAVSLHYGRQGLIIYQTLQALGYEVMTIAFWVEFEQMLQKFKPAIETIELPEMEIL